VQIEDALRQAAPEPNMYIGERQTCCNPDDDDIASVNTMLRQDIDFKHNDIDRDFDFESEADYIPQIYRNHSV
jgi:hypothetical protein